VSTATTPASASEALAMVHAGLAFLAAADATAMGAAERATCLRGLERADAVVTAARSSVLGAFAAGQDYAEDGDYSPCSWLRYRTRVTQGTAADHTAWVKRGAGHPAVLAALAAGAVSRSYAREICWWTGKLPEEARPAADEILLSAAASGLGLADLAGLAAEMYERSRQGKPDIDPGDGEDGGGDPGAGSDDRSVTLATTIGGAGVVHGGLTPECAEFVRTVLDALSAPAGADDDRSHEQRYHDALQEAMSRLIAAGLAPRQGGQPVRVWAYISLADLMQLDGSAELAREWMAGLAAQWAGRRAAAAEAGGHQGLWLDGDAAKGIACGAPVTPVVVGNVNPAAFGDLIKLCAQLDQLLGSAGRQPDEDLPDEDLYDVYQPGEDLGAGGAADAPAGSAVAREALVQAILGKAAELLSGPGGLASFLRRGRRPAGGRAEPAAGHRLQRDHPGVDPERGPAPRPALPVGRRLPPARLSLPGPPRQAQSQRRADQPHRLRPALCLPPPGDDPPQGLDPGREPRRHHHRLEQGQDQSAPQPRAARPRRVTTPAVIRRGETGTG
jgi:Domain of unknown function (DUF222)